MNELYIYHHLGLGDHMICNGIIRHYAKIYEKIHLFVKKHNFESVEFMYRDLENMNLIVGDDNFIKIFIINNKIKNLLRIGFENCFFNNKPFDIGFYEQIGLDFNKRWDNFYVKRDNIREINFFKKFNINDKYIFLHDGGSGGSSLINRKYLSDKNLQIIEAKRHLTDNIFDYCHIIENAEEIHCIESAFTFIIDSIKTNGNLFSHRYVKNPPLNEIPTLRKNWNILT